jgi:hypothetical protein
VLNRFVHVAIFIITVLVFYVLLVGGPVLLYKARSPSAMSECGSIKRGMKRQEVVRFLRSKSSPREVRSLRDQLISIRDDGSCIVRIDPQTDLVQDTRFDSSMRTWSEQF